MSLTDDENAGRMNPDACFISTLDEGFIARRLTHALGFHGHVTVLA